MSSWLRYVPVLRSANLCPNNMRVTGNCQNGICNAGSVCYGSICCAQITSTYRSVWACFIILVTIPFLFVVAQCPNNMIVTGSCPNNVCQAGSTCYGTLCCAPQSRTKIRAEHNFNFFQTIKCPFQLHVHMVRHPQVYV